MKAYVKLLSIVIVLFLTLSPDIASSQFADLNLIGAGARARGMGGAFIGVADDATAASWNPAGLVFLEKPEASIVYVYSSMYQTVDDEVEDLELNHGYLNFGSAAVPLALGQNNFVACVAYQRMLDLYNKGQDVLFDNSGTSYYYDTHTKGGVDAISPSIGIQLSPQVALGAALNIYTGKTTVDWESWDSGNEIDAPEEKYSGTNFTVGGLLDFGTFRLGGVFKSPFTLKSERGEEFGTEINFFGYEDEFKMPTMFGVGAMFEPIPNLRLAVDYEYRGYANAEEKRKWTSADRSYLNTDEFDDAGLEDVNQFRFGLEYLLLAGDNVIPLRAGFKTEPKPFTDDNDDQVVGLGLTLGLGFVTKVFSLSGTMEYSAYTLEYEYYDSWGSTITEIVNSQLNFVISGIIYFGN